MNVLYSEKKKGVVITEPWIQIHGYADSNLLKQVKKTFKGFEGQYPMNTCPVD
jgi:hypothetical protein